MRHPGLVIFLVSVLLTYNSCLNRHDSNKEMVDLLAVVDHSEYKYNNTFCPAAKLAFYDSLLKNTPTNSPMANMTLQTYALYEAKALLELGHEEASIKVLDTLLSRINPSDTSRIIGVLKEMAMANLRFGERVNCVYNHAASSCVFPIQGDGVQLDKRGTSSAIRIYEALLKHNPNDLESRWLLNIAYMSIGKYPQSVPNTWLIPNLDTDTDQLVKPFTDMAINTGLNTNNQAGGNIVDDFNNDNLLDIVTSSWSLSEGMHYSRNNGNGTFTNVSDSSGLSQFTGGLNMMQTDYNNDGLKDIFVLRGAWKGKYGKEPNSLLRNNGDGTFSDVTKESGLLSFHPTQTATWNDFNNDGWLDLFIGNETNSVGDLNTCEFFINNKNGTFTESAVKSKLNIAAFVKGVTSGDYDNDGWQDIFISTLGDQKILLKNEGVKDGVVQFKNVTAQAGLGSCHTKTFPTCFFDFDNDGWLDILICSYEFSGSLAVYAAKEALHISTDSAGKQYLFRNNHDGTFEDVTDKVGLNKVAFAMGMNFGDIDNDGYPDLYLGTGNPLYQSLVPNKMFRNDRGKRFIDVTSSARVGNLQKGHGVAFADLDNDGDQDIYIEMGGAYDGDAYQNSLFINPGQNNNNWINLNLEGTISNRAAIGSRIKVSFTEDGVPRSVYRDVNSGGSFGANPLMQHIGIGTATIIDSIQITWAASKTVQVFRNIKPRQTLKIKENSNELTRVNINPVDFSNIRGGLISCSPAKTPMNPKSNKKF